VGRVDVESAAVDPETESLHVAGPGTRSHWHCLQGLKKIYLFGGFSENTILALDALKIDGAEPKRLKTVSPLAWDGKSFQNEGEYDYNLTVEEIGEIGEALKNFQSKGVFSAVGIDADEPLKATLDECSKTSSVEEAVCPRRDSRRLAPTGYRPA
jgi:hypothetical protein